MSPMEKSAREVAERLRVRGHIALDVAVNFHLATIADLAPDDHVLADYEYALICHHRLSLVLAAPDSELNRAQMSRHLGRRRASLRRRGW